MDKKVEDFGKIMIGIAVGYFGKDTIHNTVDKATKYIHTITGENRDKKITKKTK